MSLDGAEFLSTHVDTQTHRGDTITLMSGTFGMREAEKRIMWWTKGEKKMARNQCR